MKQTKTSTPLSITARAPIPPARLERNSSLLPDSMRRFGTFLLAAISLGAATCHAQNNWWKLTDDQFAQQFAQKATGSDLTEQSRVAWMLFARANQPVTYPGTPPVKVTQWELWPSDIDTFDPTSAKAFKAVGKVRSSPHLQISKVEKMLGLQGVHNPDGDPDPGQNFKFGTEEVTRNLLSYDYIMANNLNLKTGVTTMVTSGKQVQFPIGVVETKAVWTTKATPGAYTFVSQHDGTTYSLLALHIMAKFNPTQADPFTADGNWFWTTFEFKGNPGLAHAQSLLLPTKDNLPPAESLKLLTDSGVTAAFSKMANYRCNGTQVSFLDSTGKATLLGNTKLENFGFAPTSASASAPAKWKSWKISCHTCHGESSAKVVSGILTMQPFGPANTSQSNVGKIPPTLVNGFTSLDFNWAIDFFAK